MKLLYVTGLYADSIYEQLRSYSSVPLQNAPDVFQKAILKGLVENAADFNVIAYPFIPSYPFRYRKLTVPSAVINWDGHVVGCSDSFNAFFLTKDRSVRHRLFRYVLKWIKEQRLNKDDAFAILTYTPSSSFLLPLAKIKKRFPNAIIVSIITDLVDNAADFASNRSIVKRIQLYAEKRKIQRNYDTIDKFILLTNAMVEKIPQAANNHLIIEGVYGGESTKNELKKAKPKTIVYSGALLTFAGILELIRAFNLIKDREAELVILGSGECKDAVVKASELNPRIHYLGPQPREVALKYQREATMLVNPRRPNSNITRYSFPSKTMEYLASGTPMIGYRLEGIPEEYFKFINTPDDMSVESLAKKIDELLNMSDNALADKGEAAQDFIFNNKMAVHQVKKIIEYIES